MKKINYILGIIFIGLLFVVFNKDKEEIVMDDINLSLQEVVYRDVSYPQVKASLGDQEVSLAVAHNDELRALGLSGVSDLPRGEGMLFPFEKEGFHGFWMKDMVMNIDIIWINSEGSVVHIEHNIAPDTYPHSFGREVSSRYVVELSAGRTRELGVKVGDIFKLL